MPADPRSRGELQRNGRVVPVYAMTSGRTRSVGPDLPIESLVMTTGRWAEDLEREYRVIVEMAAAPVSIAEVGAALDAPLGVARVLVSDLADAGYLVVHTPPTATPDGRPEPESLVRLLEGLRAR